MHSIFKLGGDVIPTSGITGTAILREDRISCRHELHLILYLVTIQYGVYDQFRTNVTFGAFILMSVQDVQIVTE